LLLLPIYASAGNENRNTEDIVNEVNAHLHEKFESIRTRDELPGINVAFVLANGLAGATAVGYSDVEKHTPLRTTDRMFSGSTGKTFVSAVVMQLVDDHKLSLNLPIATWLGKEWWFTRLPNANKITLRMLLNHTSGIPNHVESAEFAADVRHMPQRVWKPEELVAYDLDKKPLFRVGSSWYYTDTNYILAGMIIERVTGHAYYEEVTRRILVPLRLNATEPSDRPELKGVIPGYDESGAVFGLPKKVMATGKFEFNPQLEWTGGGLVTTPTDLAHWAKDVYEHKVFSAASLTEVLEGVDIGKGFRYGLGVLEWQSNYGRVYGHMGEFPGYLTVMAYWPRYRSAVAVQLNKDQSEEGKAMDLRERLAQYAIAGMDTIVETMRVGTRTAVRNHTVGH
jgi:D-alanyl-D-alanine carboxypeptidase